MYTDAITIAAVAAEWRTLLTGARIDTIIQPTEHAIAVQCYTPGTQEQSGRNLWLYISAHPQLARTHLTTHKPTKIVSEPPSFVMLLRKYLEGGRIESIQQPRWERVLELTTGHRSGPDSDERVHYRLIIELMGRLSNIILCDQHGLILGSLKHVSAEVNRYRVIAAHVQYVPPPPQQHTFAGQSLPRLEPTIVTTTQLISIAADSAAPIHPDGGPSPIAKGAASASTGHDSTPLQSPNGGSATKKARQRATEPPKLWQLLAKHLLGLSSLLAREAVYRTTGDTETVVDGAVQDDAVWEKLAWNVRELCVLYDTHAWQPQLVLAPPTHQPHATAKFPIAFAPYILEQYAAMPGVQLRLSPSINILIDEYYAGAEWRDAMEGVRAPLRRVLQTQHDRSTRKVAVLQQALATSQDAAPYRLQAELLLSSQHEVQRGQSSVTLRNIFESESVSEVTIPLDPRFDAVGNANRFFNKYHKLRRATALIPAQIEQNALALATIEQLLADLMLADTPAEVALVKAEVQAAGFVRKADLSAKEKNAQKAHKGRGGKQAKKKPIPPGGGVPLHVQSRDGFTLLIGKNSRQNEEVTFHQATANDMWLHARGVPGAHVVIKAAGREVPQSTIEQAAGLAAYYSQARESTGVSVDYTLQRYVRHIKGGGPGMVTYERERTIYTAPEK